MAGAEGKPRLEVATSAATGDVQNWGRYRARTFLWGSGNERTEGAFFGSNLEAAVIAGDLALKRSTSYQLRVRPNGSAGARAGPAPQATRSLRRARQAFIVFVEYIS